MDIGAPKEAPKSVLLIKTMPKGLIALEGFLRGHGWTVHSTANLKDALQLLVKEHPTFVLISLDHPNRKVRSLPNVLTQAFPVHVFVFSESGRGGAFKGLKESANLRKLHPPLTGTSVEQALNAVFAGEKEVIQTEEQGAAIVRGGQKKTWENINIKEASKILKSVDDVAQKQEAKEKGELIWQKGAGPGVKTKDFGEEENTDEVMSAMQEGGLGDVADYKPDEVEADDAVGAAYAPEEKKKRSTEEGYVPEAKGKDPKVADQNPQEPQVLKKKKRASWPGEAPEEDDEKDPVEAKLTEASISRRGGVDVDELDHGPKPPTEVPSFDALDKKKKAPAEATPPASQADEIVPLEDDPTAVEKARQKQAEAAEASKPETKKQASSVAPPDPKTFGKVEIEDLPAADVQDLRKVLEEAMQVGDGKIERPLTESTVVSCLPVESSTQSGYVLVALGNNEPMDEELISNISAILIDRLGKSVQVTDWVSLKIQPVDFKSWAEEDAEFTQKTVHQGHEVAIAFFSSENPKTRLGASEKEEFGTLEMSELKPDSTLHFDMSIYLPANKRFIFYIARGANFVRSQYERLVRLGLTQIHISRSQLREVNQYRAENILNARIVSHREKKQLKSA